MSKCWYCNEELTTSNYCDEHIGICTKCYGSMFKVSNDFVKGLTDKIADLEAKLAESEEDVDKLNSIIGRLTYYLDKFNYVGEHPFYNTTREQDKISFAVEQLEAVKELLYPELRFDYSLYLRVMHEIDNQIEELKKEMK